MTWTGPTTRTTGELITAAIWNTDIVDNLEILKDPPSDFYLANEVSNWQTTSTSFTNVDGTLLSLSVTTTAPSTDLQVTFNGNVLNTTSDTYFDLLVNGARLRGDDGIIGCNDSGNVPGVSANFTTWILGLTPQTHTINLQWRVTAGTANLYAGAGTSNADLHSFFYAREVS